MDAQRGSVVLMDPTAYEVATQQLDESYDKPIVSDAA